MRRLLLPLPLLVALGLVAGGWVYPRSGQNYPSQGRAHDYIAAAACGPGKSVGCFGMANGSTVPFYLYETYGAVPNPHFISEYTFLLQSDCYFTPRIQEACQYLNDQLAWLEANGKSPHKGLSVWPVWNGIANGMVQGELAEVFVRQFDFTGNSHWLDLADRAGRAFDWSAGNGGVAHVYESGRYWYISSNVGHPDRLYVLNQMNFALLSLDSLCKRFGGDWCVRLDRGLATLTRTGRWFVSVDDFAGATYNGISDWSYHRVAIQTYRASCSYHDLNARTLSELSRARGGISVFQQFIDRWRASYNVAVSAGLCPPSTW